MSRRSAYNAISVYQTFGNESVPRVAHFPTKLLYDLATEAAAPVREKILPRVRAGETLADPTPQIWGVHARGILSRFREDVGAFGRARKLQAT